MSDVSITDVETYIVSNPWKPWVFVRLETDAGATGLAEATTHNKPRTVTAAIEEMSDYFVGRDPFNTEQIWFEMYCDEWFSKNVVTTTVCSAADIACWDTKGKLLDKPVYELLGGPVHGRPGGGSRSSPRRVRPHVIRRALPAGLDQQPRRGGRQVPRPDRDR